MNNVIEIADGEFALSVSCGRRRGKNVQWKDWATEPLSANAIEAAKKLAEREGLTLGDWLLCRLRAGIDAEFEKRRCAHCGCTDDDPCEGGCWWVDDDCCSACGDKLPEAGPGPRRTKAKRRAAR